MSTVRGCLTVFGRFAALVLGALFGAGLSFVVGLAIWLSNFDGARPLVPAPFGALMALIGLWAAGQLLRGWSRQAILLLAALTAAGGALLTWALGHYAGVSAAAGAVSTFLFAGGILRRPLPPPAAPLLAMAVVATGGLWGWAIAGWGVPLAGATAGLVWGMVDPDGVGDRVLDVLEAG